MLPTKLAVLLAHSQTPGENNAQSLYGKNPSVTRDFSVIKHPFAVILLRCIGVMLLVKNGMEKKS
jgi:hypothetical protein